MSDALGDATPAFGPRVFLPNVSEGWARADYKKGRRIFSQGDEADAIFYIQEGKVTLTVLSPEGKEAVIAILGANAFFGERCLVGQPRRMSGAISMSDCSIMRLELKKTISLLRLEPMFSQALMHYLLSRNIRMEEDLADHLFNSSEKRLARMLLLLADYGTEANQDPVILKISQGSLAEMIGTTRSRVNFLMNKFRKLGFVEYNQNGLSLYSSLLDVIS